MANLKRADRAIAAYSEKLNQTEQALLGYFRALWEEQAAIGKELAPAYEVPGIDKIKQLSKEKMPILRIYPAAISPQTLAEASSRMATALCTKGGFANRTTREIEGIDWKATSKIGAAVAGSNPEECIEVELDALAQTGLSQETLQIAMSAVSLALRGLLEPVADALMDARKQADVAMQHPVQCPVCGCGATIAAVGASTSTSGGARQLFCTQCGTVWDFDRIRCARCGTRNQGHLHYYHVGEDDAHRIHTCDECGGYIRTVFQENILAPMSLDVEDVVMAKLDLVAQQKLTEDKEG